LIPGCVPAVMDIDTERCVIVIERAPRSWHTWKHDLLKGDVSQDVATHCGHVLALLHATTSVSGILDSRFDDLEAFEQLRIDPYYHTAAIRNPAAAQRIATVIREMAERRQCLVHGDFSPKNLLIGDDHLWVIDFEVAHRGDPAFDVAFMLSHLLLKAVHDRRALERFRCAGDGFCASYVVTAGANGASIEAALDHLGCLLLARIDGKSPVEYLDDSRRGSVRALALQLLESRPTHLDEVWRLAEKI
jgi:tRNA A-37 threonylcarbamoyl transferase component Bud32